jgi:hypothetical protein
MKMDVRTTIGVIHAGLYCAVASRGFLHSRKAWKSRAFGEVWDWTIEAVIYILLAATSVVV